MLTFLSVFFALLILACMIVGTIYEDIEDKRKRKNNFGLSMLNAVTRADEQMKKSETYNPEESLRARAEISKYIMRKK